VQIKQKLTYSMQQSQAWQAFADAVQAVNDVAIEPVVTRLKSLPSLYQMHESDMAVHFEELGEIFTVGKTDVVDRPLLLQQRLDEVHFKGYMYPIEKTLSREFGSISASWKELYAPKDTDAYPYPDTLAVDERKANTDIDDWFLTSRGLIQASFIDVVKSYSINHAGVELFQQFESDLFRIIEPLIPTRIVFEGVEYAIATRTEQVRGTHVQMIALLTGKVYQPDIEPTHSTLYQGAHIHLTATLKGHVYGNE